MLIYIDNHKIYSFSGKVLSEDVSDNNLKKLGLYWMRAYDKNFEIYVNGEYSVKNGRIEIDRVTLWAPDHKYIDLSNNDYSSVSLIDDLYEYYGHHIEAALNIELN